MKNLSRVLLVGFILFLVGIFFYYDGSQYLTLEYLKNQQSSFQEYYSTHMALTIATYLAIYIVSTALSLPGATVLTIAAGALFGTLVGTILVSIASTIGATLAFLAARFLFRDSIQSKFREKLRVINEGVEREGGFYLFTLRLVPLFPFFMINLVMGLTPIKTRHFFFISQVGMLPGTIVYVNAGTQLAQIESLKGILSPNVILSFALLGVFPLLAKKILEFLKRKRSQKEFL